MRIRAWRVVQQRFVDTAFTGEGASLGGGRWNRRGTSIIYCSESISLATLEILANLDYGLALLKYVSIPIDFEESHCIRIATNELPHGWDSESPSAATQNFGSAWVASQRSLALAVPSAVVESETNYLINPAHPQFSEVQIGRPSPLKFNPRLLR